jgi:hypothetical protein
MPATIGSGHGNDVADADRTRTDSLVPTINRTLKEDPVPDPPDPRLHGQDRRFA